VSGIGHLLGDWDLFKTKPLLEIFNLGNWIKTAFILTQLDLFSQSSAGSQTPLA
jgi:hypothetical protein